MKQLIQNITTSIPTFRAGARRLVLLAVLLVGGGQAWALSTTVNLEGVNASNNSYSTTQGNINFSFSNVSRYYTTNRNWRGQITGYNYFGFASEHNLLLTGVSSSEKDARSSTLVWSSDHAGYDIKVTQIVATFKTDISDALWGAYGVYGSVSDGSKKSYTSKMYKGNTSTSSATISNSDGLGTTITFTSGHNSIGGETYLNSVNLTYTRTAKKFTVTLNQKDGSGGTGSVTATYNSPMPAGATAPTRTGYTFQGYYDVDASSGGTQYYDANMISAHTWDKTSNTTLYARWTANTYTVTLNRKGGTGGSSSVTATFDAAMPAGATAPTKSGYSFQGYYGAESGGTKYYNADMSSANKWDKALDATLYAHWAAVFNFNVTAGYVDINSSTHAWGNPTVSGITAHQKIEGVTSSTQTATFTANPADANCTFIGWYSKANIDPSNDTPVSTSATYTTSVTNSTPGSNTELHLYAYYKHNQTLTWVNPSLDTNDPLVVDKSVVNTAATSSMGQQVTYTSSNDEALEVDANGNLTPKAEVPGTVCITATAGNNLYNTESITRCFIVKERKTPVFDPASGQIYNKKVEDTFTINVDKVSDGLDGDFRVSASPAGIVSWTRSGNVLTISCDHPGSTTLTLSQTGNEDIYAATATYTINVTRYANTLSLTVPNSYYVGESKTVTFTGKNSNADIQVLIKGVINSTQRNPNQSFKDSVISYAGNSITAWNKGSATITFIQPENNKFEGFSKTVSVNVDKCSNSISTKFDNVNATSKTIHLAESTNLSISSTNKNNTDYQVVLTSSNASIVSYTDTGTSGTFASNYKEGNTTWIVTQAEDYKYQEGTTTISVNVSALSNLTAGSDCYLNESVIDCDNDHRVYDYNLGLLKEHTIYTVTEWDNPLHLAGEISFLAKKSSAGTNPSSVVIEQLVNGSWIGVDNGEVSGLSDSYPSSPFTRQLNASATQVRFKDGSGTLAKYVKCVKIKKLPYLAVSPDSLTFETTRQNVAVSPLTFDIEWSGNNTGDIHIVSSDPTHFTMDKSFVNHSDCGDTTITVTYHPVDIGTHNGTITIYDKGRVKTVAVTGITQPKYDLVINAPSKTIYVDDNVASGFSFSYAGNNLQVPSPGAGSGSSHFFYEIENRVNSNINGCNPSHQEDVVTYDPLNNTLKAWNAGTAVITFYETGSTEVNARNSQSVEIKVEKRDNTLKTPFVTEDSWSAIMNYGAGRYVRIESDNADATNSPIVVTPLTGQNYATYYDDQKAIYTVGPEGVQTATWSVSQAENFKYKATETKTMTVTIQAAAEEPCYVLNEPAEKSFINGIEVYGHFDGDDVYEVTGPANELSFEARIGIGGINESFGVKYFVVQYSVDGGNAWTEIARPDISTSYQHFSYDLDTIDGITHIRFGAYEGGTGFKFYKNVMITRKTYLNADDVEVSSKGDGTPIYPGEVGHAILKIDYSLASGGTLHISNDNPSAFELSEAEITNVDCATNTAEVQITYHARTGVEGTEGTAEDVAHISLYNTTYSKSVTLTGVTTKRNQIGQWKEHIETLTVGTVVEDAYWATLSQQNGVTYTIVEGDAIEINSDNNLVAVKEGDVTIQAHVDGDGIYNSITSELFPIYVTSKYTQYIDWNQNLLHLTIGDDNVVLTATAMSDIDGCTTNGSRPIVYYVKDGSDNVVKVVNGNELQVIGIGTVSVIASQAGGVDSDGHDYAPTSVEKKVVVRDPSAPCETYIYEQDKERRFDMGAVPFYKRSASQEIDFGGQEPESYTFEYKGEYKNRVMFDGTMSVEQYVNGAWSLVEDLGKPSISTYKIASHTLNRNATKMRVSIHGAQGYHYFKECQVKLARYMEVYENGVQMSPQTLAFKILVNGSQSRTISVKYSNISGPLSFVLPEDAPFTLDKTALEGSCGDRGTIELTITYVPTVIETDGVYTLTITDGVLTQQVELNATANLLECIYPETAPNKDWHADDNWSTGAVPNSSCRAILEHDVVITGSAYVYGINMDEGVHLTIAPTGALTVGAGGISSAGELPKNLILEANQDGQIGALRIHPKAEAPNATVQFYSTIANSENSDDWKWQYIGTPVSNPDMNERIFYNCWLYKHDAATNTWDNAGNWNRMEPFLGYAFTRNDADKSYSRPSSGPLFAFTGKLNAPETKSLTLTVGAEGQNENHLANSWTAPIRVSKFTEDDLSGIDKKTIYYYPIDYRGNVEGLPPFSAKYTGSDVIPAMQGFFVLANENGAKLVLNYEKLIWDVNAINNEPLKAPSREREEQDELLSRVCINLLSADSIPDHIYLLEKEGEGFSREFTEGYDAPKYFVDGLPCIYTYETSGPHLAVSATDDVVGTYLAINTNASQNYTLTFSKVIGEGLGLRDLVTNTIVPITEGMQYAFTAPANSSPMLRFVVVEHEETPQWNNNNGTSLEDVGGEFKIWQSGEILSVIGAGSHASLRLYDAAGKLILSEFFNEATAINLNALPTGVYMVQVNDKTEKVLR